VPVVAMNELDYDNARACGAYLEVTGPGGTTMVEVTDRCPECVPGQLDMSTQAFDRISGGAVGRIDQITWRLASPADIGPVEFKVKKESSQYWLSLQVRDHRNPIASLEVRVNGSWVTVPRQMWNYFEAEGLGPGPYTVRITDVYGEQLVDTVNLAPDTVQTTDSQFARH
jgi:expansin (peptidoglycan-binding protein)